MIACRITQTNQNHQNHRWTTFEFIRNIQADLKSGEARPIFISYPATTSVEVILRTRITPEDRILSFVHCDQQITCAQCDHTIEPCFPAVFTVDVINPSWNTISCEGDGKAQ
tara:strand:+ start:82 stop:417 length:336 start_codon:yes stop_codon:yes gene_type:complete